MPMTSLHVRDISVEFSGLKALTGVSLSIGPGDILGLIGPNGSGKTTLVNAITGQVQMTGGAVTLADENIGGLSPRQIALKGVSRSFQIVRLFNNMTVIENVEAAALAHGVRSSEARARASELLAEFGLSAREDEMASELSYGDKRRIEIARALAANPSFLLLDEPAAGMNEAESDRLLHILQAIAHSRQLGLLIIDHDMPLIMRLCQRLHVIASGRTIATGDPESVRSNPAVIEAYLGTGAAYA